MEYYIYIYYISYLYLLYIHVGRKIDVDLRSACARKLCWTKYFSQETKQQITKIQENKTHIERNLKQTKTLSELTFWKTTSPTERYNWIYIQQTKTKLFWSAKKETNAPHSEIQPPISELSYSCCKYHKQKLQLATLQYKMEKIVSTNVLDIRTKPDKERSIAIPKGVYYDKNHHSWIANIKHKGKKTTKSFSVNKYG